MKPILAIIAIQMLAVFCSAQAIKVTEELTLDPGIERHAGIDEIYRKFSKAYRELDPSVFGKIYSKNAAYLVPGENIDIGDEAIVNGFERFFTSVKNNDRQIAISFQIVQRKVGGKLGYDVGIYTLRTYKDGKEISSGRGKFVVVAVREGNQWKFQVDGYSDMPVEKPKQ